MTSQGAPEAGATDFLLRLREANIVRDREYRGKTGGEPLPLLFRTTELAGEVGELLNVIKKLERERLGWSGKRATREMVLEEIGGVMAVLDLLAMQLDIDLATATTDEFNKVTDRLGLGTRLAGSPSPPPGVGEEAMPMPERAFITSIVGDGDPYVKIQFAELAEMQDFYRKLALKAMAVKQERARLGAAP